VTHTLIMGPEFNEPLSKWACRKIPWSDYSPSMRAVGVADGAGADARLLAVCIYHNFRAPMQVRGETWYNSVEITFATDTPRWATRRTIRDLLKIPFNQFKVEQVFVVVPSINVPALRFVKGIGFTPRGTVSRFYSNTVHACVFGLHRNQFNGRHFLAAKRKAPVNRRPHGQQEQLTGAAAV
jgi:hypothetical protein